MKKTYPLIAIILFVLVWLLISCTGLEMPEDQFSELYKDYQMNELIFGFFEFIKWADGFFVLALILIFADIYFGIKKARVLGEEVRFSRACRRTIEKINTYIIFIILAYSFGEVFFNYSEFEIVPLVLLGFIYVMEMQSIYSNYCKWQGIPTKVNLVSWFSSKTNNIIEVEDSNETKTEENETK